MSVIMYALTDKSRDIGLRTMSARNIIHHKIVTNTNNIHHNIVMNTNNIHNNIVMNTHNIHRHCRTMRTAQRNHARHTAGPAAPPGRRARRHHAYNLISL